MDVLKTYLTTDLHIEAQRIAVATGSRRGVDGVDLFERGCAIEFIITVEALREGCMRLKLKSLLNEPQSMQSAASPVYGEHNVTIQYRVSDLSCERRFRGGRSTLPHMASRLVLPSPLPIRQASHRTIPLTPSALPANTLRTVPARHTAVRPIDEHP